MTQRCPSTPAEYDNSPNDGGHKFDRDEWCIFCGEKEERGEAMTLSRAELRRIVERWNWRKENSFANERNADIASLINAYVQERADKIGYNYKKYTKAESIRLALIELGIEDIWLMG